VQGVGGLGRYMEERVDLEEAMNEMIEKKIMTVKEVGDALGVSTEDLLDVLCDKNIVHGKLDELSELSVRDLITAYHTEYRCANESFATLYANNKKLKECINFLKEKMGHLDEIIKNQEALINIAEIYTRINTRKSDENYGFTGFKQKDYDKNSGFVYIAKQKNETDIYKIGVTKNITQREKAFSVGNAFIEIVATKRTSYPYRLEHLLHNIFKNSNISGEWFKLSEDDLIFLIKELEFNKLIEQGEQ